MYKHEHKIRRLLRIPQSIFQHSIESLGDWNGAGQSGTYDRILACEYVVITRLY
jgi:hypothetical protein